MHRTLADDDVAKRRQIEALLDGSHGSCLLRRPECAHLVEEILLAQDDRSYQLIAWAIMPNHVHVLIATKAGIRLADIVKQWKGASAHAINQVTGRSGRLWQREYWDRFIRDEAHFLRTQAYIEGNPVQAGLVETPEAWRWSSAWRRGNGSGMDIGARGGPDKAPAG